MSEKTYTILAKPIYVHDCNSCEFLGATIGGGKMVDLYYHKPPGDRSLDEGSLIARYGNERREYFSTSVINARPEGHAELYAARALFQIKYSEG